MVNLGGLQDLRGYTRAPARSNGVGALAVPAASAAGNLAKKAGILPCRASAPSATGTAHEWKQTTIG
jgi:hypothetical protein